MKGILNMITRKELYSEIWEISLSGVAKKYELNYEKLKRICIENSIPCPASGYWTRKKMGKDISNEIILLSGDPNLEIDLTIGKKHTDVKKVVVAKESVGKDSPLEDAVEGLLKSAKLNFLDDSERRNIFQVAMEMQVTENTRLHKKVVSYRTSLEGWKKRNKNSNSYEYNYERNISPPVSATDVSEKSWPRMFRILDALYRAIEKLGGTVQENLSVKVKNDIVKFHFAEGEDKVPHELTKKEARELLEYNEKVKWNKWAYKPNIRKYDHIYNGRLRIVIGEGQYVRDSDTVKIEEKLADMLIMFYEEAEKERVKREKREEEERIREEKARQKRERIERYNIEVERTFELINAAEDYEIACRLRKYINAMETIEELSPEQKEWIVWARKKADWFDPIVDREDEFFGKRKHVEKAENKALKKQGGFSYYW